MGVTAPTDISGWAVKVISTTINDLMFDSKLSLSSFAEVHNELEGKPGDSINFPTLNSVTPADNLAVTTAAVDDLLSGGVVAMTVKEAVKSIAFYDRTQYVNGTDVDRLAGEKVAQALINRVELDLGAAAYVGRGNAGAEPAYTTMNLTAIRGMRSKLPSQLRPGLGRENNKPVLFADNDTLSQLYEDATVANAAAFGNGQTTVSGDFSAPIYGIRLVEVDQGVFGATGLTGQQRWAALIAPNCLGRALQKNPSSTPERDERSRLTRIVGTCLHAEGVTDSRGVIFAKVGAAA